MCIEDGFSRKEKVVNKGLTWVACSFFVQGKLVLGSEVGHQRCCGWE